METTIQEILFTPEEMPEEHLKEQERAGHYTGERLEAQRPAIYRAVVLMLAVGLGRLEVEKRCGVSHHTVEAVRIREGAAIAIDKKRLAGRMRDVVAMGVDAITEDFLDEKTRARMSTKDKAIVLGILNQHSQLLEGEATSIVGKSDGSEKSVDAVADWIRGLKQITETGHGSGEAKQKGAGGESGALVGAGGPGADVRGQDWLDWLGRFRALMAGVVVLALPDPNGPPGANFGPTAVWESTDINGGMGDA